MDFVNFMVASPQRAKQAAVALLILVAITNLIQSRPIYNSTFVLEPSVEELSPADNSLHDTTIIITSSLIPSHPSVGLINQTISSLRHIEGLPPRTPIIITVDGAPSHDFERSTRSNKRAILEQYVQSLRATYYDSHNVTIVQQRSQIHLIGNVRKALEQVQTEFVYMVQHDMAFISPINHPALVRTFQDYPEEVRLVRFSPRKTLVRGRDKMGLCGPVVDFEANGIELAKTHTWSDNNHFTRKSYYDEMFSTVEDWDGIRYMETKMNPLGAHNCSYWGTYLYGKQGTGPAMIVHLNGRKHPGLVETPRPNKKVVVETILPLSS